MRSIALVLVLIALAATVSCFPESRTERESQQDDDSNTQIVIVPLETNIHRKEVEVGEDGLIKGFGDQPIVDTGVFSSNPFFSNPFSGFLSSIEAMLNRMRQQMGEVLKRLPEKPEDGQDTDDISVGAIWPQFNIPEGKGNTSSVTKIIDGHKVVINETTYADQKDHGGAFFKVRIVDIKPNMDENIPTEKESESVGAVGSTVGPKRDVESIEESIENEIQKDNKNEGFNNIETFDEIDSLSQRTQNLITNEPNQQELFDDLEAFEPIVDNSVEYGSPVELGHDLSDDILVNKLMADGTVKPDPDAEVFDPIIHSSFGRNGQTVEMLKK